MIGVVAATAAGRNGAIALAEAWPEEVSVYAGPVVAALEEAFAECDAVVAFLATGATVRILAPLLKGKDADPGVVCVDEAYRFAIALLGGHLGGANVLAERVAAVLGAAPVISTATDARDIPGLDTLGWPVEGAVAAVSRAIVDGEPVRLIADARWPLPALPPNVGDAGAHRLLVTDRIVPLDERTAVLRPPSLVLGVGGSRGVTAEEVLRLIAGTLHDARLSPESIRELASVTAKSDEAGLLEAAEILGVPITFHAAETLAAIEVPNPSDVVQEAVGTPSVAEAAALVGGGELAVPKQRSAMATVAVARVQPRGRLAIVGLGPGARDLLTPRAEAELRRAAVIVGLDQYVDQIRDLLRPGTTVLESGLGKEEERAHTAVAQARAGHAVALIGSGDAGVYAMASPALEVAGADIDVVGVPGVTAALAASAVLGAPLGHDHVSISLSDLHTPWEAIRARVDAAAASDLVVTFYNPRSKGRDWQLPEALAILAKHRPPTTPVGVVRNASRPDESRLILTIGDDVAEHVDMYCVVVVGNSNTKLAAGRMVTPRGYKWSQ